MNGWLIVWSRPMGRARSSPAWGRSPGGTNRSRAKRAMARSTRGSLIPRAWTWRAIAAPGGGSGGQGMAVLLSDLEVLHLELDLTTPVPFVQRRLVING